MARSFDGVNDTAVSSVVGQAAKYTWAAWVYPTALPGANQIAVLCDYFSGSDEDKAIFLRTVSGVTYAEGYIYDGGNKNVIGTTGWSANVWRHLAITVDGTNINVYVNGVLEASTAAGDSYTGFVNPTHRLAPLFSGGIGHGGDTHVRFAGRLAHVAMWSLALTAGEISTLVRRGPSAIARASGRLFYLPLGGTASPEIDKFGTLETLTLTGTTIADNPPVGKQHRRPSGWRGAFGPTGGPAITTSATLRGAGSTTTSAPTKATSLVAHSHGAGRSTATSAKDMTFVARLHGAGRLTVATPAKALDLVTRLYGDGRLTGALPAKAVTAVARLDRMGWLTGEASGGVVVTSSSWLQAAGWTTGAAPSKNVVLVEQLRGAGRITGTPAKGLVLVTRLHGDGRIQGASLKAVSSSALLRIQGWDQLSLPAKDLALVSRLYGAGWITGTAIEGALIRETLDLEALIDRLLDMDAEILRLVSNDTEVF